MYIFGKILYVEYTKLWTLNIENSVHFKKRKRKLHSLKIFNKKKKKIVNVEYTKLCTFFEKSIY